jgi:hypothetical protein
LIRADEHADAPDVSGAGELSARGGQKVRQHIHYGRCQSATCLIVALTDDEKAIATVDRPITVRFQIGEQEPLVSGHGGLPASGEYSRRRTRTQPQQCAPIHFITP